MCHIIFPVNNSSDENLIKCLIIALFVYALSACRKKCEECTYIEEVNGEVSEVSLGTYCGDEIKTLEKKEYNVAGGEGHTECE